LAGNKRRCRCFPAFAMTLPHPTIAAAKGLNGSIQRINSYKRVGRPAPDNHSIDNFFLGVLRNFLVYVRSRRPDAGGVPARTRTSSALLPGWMSWQRSMLMPVAPSPWLSTRRNSIPSAISPGIGNIGAGAADRSSTLSCWRAGRHWSVGSCCTDIAFAHEADIERKALHGREQYDIQRPLAFRRARVLHLGWGCSLTAERSARAAGATFAGVVVAGRCRSARRRPVSLGPQPHSHRNDAALIGRPRSPVGVSIRPRRYKPSVS
jgi:hypothetical protein